MINRTSQSREDSALIRSAIVLTDFMGSIAAQVFNNTQTTLLFL